MVLVVIQRIVYCVSNGVFATFWGCILQNLDVVLAVVTFNKCAYALAVARHDTWSIAGGACGAPLWSGCRGLGIGRFAVCADLFISKYSGVDSFYGIWKCNGNGSSLYYRGAVDQC